MNAVDCIVLLLLAVCFQINLQRVHFKGQTSPGLDPVTLTFDPCLESRNNTVTFFGWLV